MKVEPTPKIFSSYDLFYLFGLVVRLAVLPEGVGRLDIPAVAVLHHDDLRLGGGLVVGGLAPDLGDLGGVVVCEGFNCEFEWISVVI